MIMHTTDRHRAHASPNRLLLLLAAVLIASTAFATEPRLVPFQARLADAAGADLTGVYRVTFVIYDAATGGTALWSEVHPAVSVIAGRLNVLLGSLTSLDDYNGDGNTADAVRFGQPRFVGIKIGADNNQEMVPRHQLVPAFYAQGAKEAENSARLAGYDWSAILVGGSTNPEAGTIRGDKIQVQGITGAQIAPSAITADRIAPKTITSSQVADATIDATKLTPDLLLRVIPAGVILPYAGSTIPAGWLACDGGAYPRVTYAALFAVIGTTFGAGQDGISTFNVPDFRGRTAVGSGQGIGLSNRPIGQAVGEESHKLTLNEMPSHTHQLRTMMDSDGGGGYSGATWFSDPVYWRDTTAAGGDVPHNTMQPSLVVKFIIKY